MAVTIITFKCMCRREALNVHSFLICYFFQYFVGTSDTLSVQMTCLSAHMYRQISKCTDKFPNVPTKIRKSIIGGGGAAAPLPPPSGYANARKTNLCMTISCGIPNNASALTSNDCQIIESGVAVHTIKLLPPLAIQATHLNPVTRRVCVHPVHPSGIRDQPPNFGFKLV